jgi:hypothetical protein
MGGKKITGNLGNAYRTYLVNWLARGKKGNSDLCSYFFLRAGQIVRCNGAFGFLATNTIAEGDTREVGLEQLNNNGFCFHRAVSSRQWPGDASLHISQVWTYRGRWSGDVTLNNKPVKLITPFLAEQGGETGLPLSLSRNNGNAFQGSNLRGIGFVLTSEEADSLIHADQKNRAVLFPYMVGDDLNARPDQSASRWGHQLL